MYLSRFFILVITCLFLSSTSFSQEFDNYSDASAGDGYSDEGSGANLDDGYSDEGSGEGLDDGYSDGEDSSSSSEFGNEDQEGGMPKKSSRKYNVLDEYSFKKFYSRNKKKTRRWLSVSANYNLRYREFVKGYVDPGTHIAEKSLRPLGGGVSGEFFLANWLSVYAGISAGKLEAFSGKNAKKIVSENVYTGARLYFSFLYFGVGTVYNKFSTEIYNFGSGWYFDKIVKEAYWNIYYQVGANLALYKHLSIDIGIDLQKPRNSSFLSEGDFYVGLKYTL